MAGTPFQAKVLESLPQMAFLVTIPIPVSWAIYSIMEQMEGSPVTPMTVPPTSCPAQIHIHIEAVLLQLLFMDLRIVPAA